MAKTVSETDLYLETRRLLDDVLNVTENFPRYFKYSVGAKCHEKCINMLNLFTRYYLNRDASIKAQALMDFQTEFETLKTLVRIAGERGWIKGKGQHARIIGYIENITKQSLALRNALFGKG